MPDFGDDMGDQLIQSIREFFRRRAQNWFYQHRGARDDGDAICISLSGDEAASVMQKLNEENISYEVRRTSLGTDQAGKVEARTELKISQKNFEQAALAMESAIRDLHARSGADVQERGMCSVAFDDPQKAALVMAALDDAGEEYKVHRSAINVSSREDKDGNVQDAIRERVEIAFPEDRYDAVRETVRQHLGDDALAAGRARSDRLDSFSDDQRRYVDEIDHAVSSAAERTNDPHQFIALCREQGVNVGMASDGEPLFTHQNGWFTVRADTLGYPVPVTHADIEQQENREAMENAASYDDDFIQSHDSADIDAHTRQVEHADDSDGRSERGGKQDYDVESEARDQLRAKEQLAREQVEKTPERETPSWQDHGSR